MRRKRLILLLVLVFFGINCLLVFGDDEGEIARMSYVKEWTKPVEADMAETIETEGVLAAEEKNVYFDTDKGAFEAFLVEEGATVNVGDPLYSYQVDNYVAALTDLESKQRQLTDEINALEEAIASISNYQVPETDLSANFEDENNSIEVTGRSVDATYMKAQYLNEKENELAQKNAQLQAVEAQLSELESTGETITVESPYQGEIKTISETLNNPLITIRDSQLQAKGDLTEAQRTEVETSMPVEVTLREDESVLQGSLHYISDSPKNVSVSGSSVYPFRASFEEESALEGLLPGYHADVAITTDASNDATSVKATSLANQHLWQMTDEGILIKQPVETGIHADGRVEILQGAHSDELIAKADADQFYEDAVFVTPLKLDDIQWKHFGKYDNVNWKRFIVIGILSR